MSFDGALFAERGTTEIIIVVLRKGPSGFGMKVSGRDHVYIEHVHTGDLKCFLWYIMHASSVQ